VRGKIDARLCLLENDLPSETFLEISTEFSFVLPLKNAPSAKETPAPKIKTPVPAFTLPPDHISL